MTEDEVLNTPKMGSGNGRVKYLVFDLMEENYGVPLSSVKEVIGITDITKVPNVPVFFRGLINLRGKIISVIDLRSKLKLDLAEYQDKKTTIIITDIDGLTVGTVVDDVREVANFTTSQIECQINIQSKVSREFITGVAKTDGKKLTLLLDIGKVLNVDEMSILRKQSSTEAA